MCNCLPKNDYCLSLQVYANGIRNIDLQFIIRKLAAPVISVLLLSLCVPYVIAAGVVPAVGEWLSTFSYNLRLFLLVIAVAMLRITH